jgi:phage portal protein BeeE
VANIITPAKDTMGIMPKDADGLEKRYNNKNNAGKTVVERIPIEVHTLGNAPVDLNILESHKEAVTALCFVYGLPVDLYYGQAKYENAKVAKQTIYDSNAIPLANELAEDLLNYTGLSRDGYRLEVNTDRIDVLQDYPGDVFDNLTKMHATLNEMREAYGYDRIEEPYADQPILQMGVQFGNEGLTDDINEI